MVHRRDFLISSAAALTSGALTSGALTSGATALAAADSTANPICVFTKPFQSLSYDQLADSVAELGFDGIEATIRDGGHIEPKAVPDELPKLAEALQKRDLKVTVMASSINDASHPMTEPVLRTAAKLGIRRYRMKYVNYEPGRPIAEHLEQWRGQFRDLAALNAEIGITGVYQNHASEKMLGAAVWDLAQVLEGIPADQLAVAYDIRHATVEGGMSWPVALRMIRPHIDTVYVKDFVWGDGPRPVNVPLGQGRIDPAFFKTLAETGFSGPISLHEEYIDHRQPELVPQHWQAIKRDLATLRAWLA